MRKLALVALGGAVSLVLSVPAAANDYEIDFGNYQCDFVPGAQFNLNYGTLIGPLKIIGKDGRVLIDIDEGGYVKVEPKK
jgi:hypothetical protein